MEFTETIPVAVAVEAVDMADWIFSMSDEDYQNVAVGHHAMGVIGGGRRLGLINVEQIAGTMIVQHYRTQTSGADHVSFLSEVSEGFLMRAVPFKMKVWWEMAIKSASADSSILSCKIGFRSRPGGP